MPAMRNMQIGAVVLIAGAALSLLAHSYRYMFAFGVFSAVMLGGGAIGLAGLVQWQRQRTMPQRHAAYRPAADIEILIGAMVAVAVADRELGQDEISMIEDVSAGLLGEPLPRSQIEKVCRQMQGKNAIDQIARVARTATPEGTDLAVKGAVWAGRADGALTEAESRVIAAIAAALGVSSHRLRTCIAEADHVYDRLAPHGGKGGQS